MLRITFAFLSSNAVTKLAKVTKMFSLDILEFWGAFILFSFFCYVWTAVRIIPHNFIS